MTCEEDATLHFPYSIIRKRQVFHHLANLPTDCGSINRTLTKRTTAGGGGSGKAASRLPQQPSPMLHQVIINDHFILEMWPILVKI